MEPYIKNTMYLIYRYRQSPSTVLKVQEPVRQWQAKKALKVHVWHPETVIDRQEFLSIHCKQIKRIDTST